MSPGYSYLIFSQSHLCLEECAIISLRRMDSRPADILKKIFYHSLLQVIIQHTFRSLIPAVLIGAHKLTSQTESFYQDTTTIELEKLL